MSRFYDLSKVAYANLRYINQTGIQRESSPSGPTVNGNIVPIDTLALHDENYPGELLIERAIRRGLLDIWIPHLTLHYAFRNNVTIKGDKALDIWKAYCGTVKKKRL